MYKYYYEIYIYIKIIIKSISMHRNAVGADVVDSTY